MQRFLEILQAIFYVAMITIVILTGVHATTVLEEISRNLKRERLAHEQMLKDHVQELKELERLRHQR